MKKKDRAVFIEWYEKNKITKFNFKKEFIDYCISDVQLLKTGRLAHREITLKETGVDPTNKIMAAFLALEVYKTKFMPENSIAVIKNTKFLINKSKKELQYLDHVKEKTDITLKRQHKINNHYVDGFDEKNNTMYEFLGCFWHGCNKCYPDG